MLKHRIVLVQHVIIVSEIRKIALKIKFNEGTCATEKMLIQQKFQT